jgi:hypothetical protein
MIRREVGRLPDEKQSWSTGSRTPKPDNLMKNVRQYLARFYKVESIGYRFRFIFLCGLIRNAIFIGSSEFHFNES